MLTSGVCYGHDWQVHMAITGSSYQASAGLQTLLGENLETNMLLTASQPQYAATTTSI
jgi:hypothetical protein